MAYYNNNTVLGAGTGYDPNRYTSTNLQNSVAFVNGEEGAKNYLVAAGNSVLLMDFNINKFWVKSTGPNGIPQQMREFTFEEITPKIETAQSDFVTKQELNDLRSYLENQFNGIKNQLQNQRRGYVNDKSNVK